MTGECVPQYMRAQAIGSDTACLPECLELARKVLPGEVTRGPGGWKPPFGLGCGRGCAGKSQIGGHGALAPRMEGPEPFLASLAAHNQHALVASRRRRRQCHKF